LHGAVTEARYALQLLKFKTPGLAHVAYLLADKSEAVLVDPRRDVEEYIEAARAQNLVIKYVLETHRQEDFVMGSRRVKELLGAKIVTGEHELFGHSDIRLADGARFKVGDLELRALHTPGHTPESTCYAVFVRAALEHALGIFTGDTLFIGETGRADLTDRERTSEHAGELFDSVHEKLLPLGDQAILWPAHGAGSVCGGKIANRDDSTLGIERLSNPVFTLSKDEFIRAKLVERIPRPPYFRHMEKVNLIGGMPAGKQPNEVRLLPPKEFAANMNAGLVIDTREPEAFAGGHVPNSINVWLAGLPVFGGWIADETTHIYLVLAHVSDLALALSHLGRVGLDNVEGVLLGGFATWRDAGMPIAYSETMDARALERHLDTTSVLDVRDDSEFEEEGHISGAYHLYVGYLNQHLDGLESELKQKPNLAVTCSVGHRAGIATSLLQLRGLANAANVLGGMTAWTKLGFPLAHDRDRSRTTPQIEGERK
jgi:hydroxyacylglutathione hydrolase